MELELRLLMLAGMFFVIDVADIYSHADASKGFEANLLLQERIIKIKRMSYEKNTNKIYGTIQG